ncbi:MAG: hypothetical protein V4681_02845 [Patescibacteria group bacterium]
MQQIMFIELGVIEGCNYPLKPEQRGILKQLYPYSGWAYSLLEDGARKLLKEDLKLTDEEIKCVEFLTDHDGHGNQWGILVHNNRVVAEFGHELWGHPLSREHLLQKYVAPIHYRIRNLVQKRNRIYEVATLSASSFWIGSTLTSLALGGPTLVIGYGGALTVVAVSCLTYFFAFSDKREEEQAQLEFRKSIADEFFLA